MGGVNGMIIVVLISVGLFQASQASELVQAFLDVIHAVVDVYNQKNYEEQYLNQNREFIERNRVVPLNIRANLIGAVMAECLQDLSATTNVITRKIAFQKITAPMNPINARMIKCGLENNFAVTGTTEDSDELYGLKRDYSRQEETFHIVAKHPMHVLADQGQEPPEAPQE